MYALENSFCLAFENVGWHGIESEEIICFKLWGFVLFTNNCCLPFIKIVNFAVKHTRSVSHKMPIFKAWEPLTIWQFFEDIMLFFSIF